MKCANFKGLVYSVDIQQNSAYVSVQMQRESESLFCMEYYIRIYPEHHKTEVEVWSLAPSGNGNTQEKPKCQQIVYAILNNCYLESYFEKMHNIYNSLQDNEPDVVTLCKEVIAACGFLYRLSKKAV